MYLYTKDNNKVVERIDVQMFRECRLWKYNGNKQ